MAGWSGGRKVVAPGVADEATIRTFHSARFMEHPLARECGLDGNPLHEAQLDSERDRDRRRPPPHRRHSSAGHPLDRTYYQTVKGMVTPLGILEPGGTLIVASECAEGIGSPAFAVAQQRLAALGSERFLESPWAKSLADIDEWQTEMQLKSTRAARVQLSTAGLDAASRALTGVELVDDPADAIRAAIDLGGDPDIAIIPESPYVVPRAGLAANAA